jgi:hypothetical protein
VSSESSPEPVEALIRLVDKLEDRAETYVTVDEVAAAGGTHLEVAIAQHVLLVDHRTRVDGVPVTLCRLNRRHPLVARLTSWS